MTTSTALEIYSVLRRYFDEQKAIEIFNEIEPIIEEMIEYKKQELKNKNFETASPLAKTNCSSSIF